MTTIAIKYVNQPKPKNGLPGKYGSIKDPAGVTYWVKADMIHAFSPGTTVDVGVKQETWGENPVQVVTSVPSGGAPAAPTPVYEPIHDPGLPMPGEPLGKPALHAPGSSHMAHAYQVKPTSVDRMIFATAITGRAMGSGKYTPQEIEPLLRSALFAYDSHLGPVLP